MKTETRRVGETASGVPLAFVGFAFVIGLGAGFSLGKVARPGLRPTPGPVAQVTSSTRSISAVHRRIAELQKTVLQEPTNRRAWVELGDVCFDCGQSLKAIDAYARALELKADDPNVLTDQGVAYRQVGQFENAVADFEQAQKLDPKHIQSVYDLAIVYLVELNQPDRARVELERYLTIDSSSPRAQQVRGLIAGLKGR